MSARPGSRKRWFAAAVLLGALPASATWGQRPDGRATPGSDERAFEAASFTVLAADAPIELGVRPAYLVNDMRDGPLKARLGACLSEEPRRTTFSIGHRGAGIRYAEHTKEAYEAGFRMGAGVLECDVTFTKDLVLVCRHSQNDLATTTNIVATPLSATCRKPFRPAEIDANGRLMRAARAECRTSEITAAEFKTLRGKIDGFNAAARTPEEFIDARPPPREGFDAGDPNGELLTHAESIALFSGLGVKMTPELKAPSVRMPFNGMTRDDAAQKVIDEYVAAGVDPANVFPQSFDIRDVRYWIEHAPAFGRQALLLDDAGIEAQLPRARELARYKAEGINVWAPPLFALLTLDRDGRIVASSHARAAREAGLDIVAWTLERSGNIAVGNPGFYYKTIDSALSREGDVLEVLDVLARDVGVRGVFSDWPATVTLYASCVP